MTYAEQTLTEIEALGLASQHDLANGHASHELTFSQAGIIQQLPEIWHDASRIKSRDAELIYLHAFQMLAKTPSIATYDYYKICPTASCSIDIIAAWLASNNLKTALIEPTFDNLYLILKRRNVALTSLPEESIHNGGYASILKNADAIFLVNPNNPTGKIINQALMAELINWCADNSKIIILDHSFRFFIAQEYDVYEMLLSSGVTFLVLEDTGKVWPTQEIKASLLVTSANIFHEINLIYDEIFLCHSSFTLLFLSQLMHDASHHGLYDAVWKNVKDRRARFRNILDKNFFEIDKDSIHSTLSVEWVRVKDFFLNDLSAANHFKKHNLILLPGRKFYWNHTGNQSITTHIRFALLKPEYEFQQSLELLKSEFETHNYVR